VEIIKELLIPLAEIIDLVGVSILLYGTVKVLVKYVITEFKNRFKSSIQSLQKIRCEIGIYILLALDFLIASDIIHTVTELSQKQLIGLGVMVMLRTAIGYFLGKEIIEIEAHTEKK
jgi:uncharacterized membrane protein